MKAQFEKVTTLPESSFKLFMYEDKSFDAPWHFHPEYELTYVVLSNGIRYVGNSLQQFEKDELVLLGPNLPHCWKNTGANKAGAKSIVAQWQNDILGEGWLDKREFQAISQLLFKSKGGIKFGKKTSKTIRPLLNFLLSSNPFDKLMGLINILDYLSRVEDFELLTNHVRNYSLNRKANDRITKIYDYVENKYRQKITLTEAATLVSMTEEAFCRFFKKCLHKSFFTFVNEYKINLACKLLIDTEMQVAEIGFQSGYESLPYFYRQFQKVNGISPLNFRRQFSKSQIK